MQKNLIFFLTMLIFTLIPWYYGDSGAVQPVDAFILFLFAVFFVMGFPTLSLYLKNSSVLKAFLIFSFYISVILLINYLVNIEGVTIFLTFQNVYFVLLVLCFVTMISYLKSHFIFEKYYKAILFILALDSIIPILSIMKTGINFTDRTPLCFNNANQLGFFALMNMVVFFYTALIAKEEGVRLPRLSSLYIININLLFLLISSSRACYPMILLYVISYTLIFKIRVTKAAKPILFLFLAACGITFMSVLAYKLYELTIQTRTIYYLSVSSDFKFRALQGIGQNFENVWYFLFGTGTYTAEGRNNLEFHNNFLATFHMVGLIGLLLYVYMNLVIIKGLVARGINYFLPYFCYIFYSMLHYSYRTRMNWIILAMIIFIIMDATKRKMNQGQAR